jgi:hypothetical protein
MQHPLVVNRRRRLEKATLMKKPGSANTAESGQFGAEHRVRTGDLRLGKATLYQLS